MLSMSDLALAGKRVLIREDLNVPIENGRISDDTRIRAALPAIQKALRARARVLVVSHLGRPQEGSYDASLSLAPVAASLSALLGREIRLCKDWLSGVTVAPGEAVLCENVRFERGEKADDDVLARKMAALCDVYVNDAFASAHRAEASTHGIAKYAPKVCAGPLLQAEVQALARIVKDPERPLVAVVGGSKISSKLALLESLIEKVDRLIVGGGILNTLMRAAGLPIGKSLCEEPLLSMARSLMDKARAQGGEIPLAEDCICAKEYSPTASASLKLAAEVSDDDLILDIGPKTTARFAGLLAEARTIVWNGPLGVFELEPFAAGTRAIAEAIAASQAFSIAGGGETLAAIAKFGVAERLSYLSTGGGAFLEFLEGKTLPALAILKERARADPDYVHPSEGY